MGFEARARQDLQKRGSEAMSKLWRAHRLSLIQDGNCKSPKLYAHAAAFFLQNIERSEGLQHFLEEQATSEVHGNIEKNVKRNVKLPFRFAKPALQPLWRVHGSQWTTISRSAHRAGQSSGSA
jgi:hypothetical protein